MRGGVLEYIANCPKEVHAKLKAIRKTIRTAAPKAVETTSYFDYPGYAYEGYEYNGMFTWFSFSKPYVRLHVRPNAIVEHAQALEGFKTSRAIVSFKMDAAIPMGLVKKLVRSSIKDMKDSSGAIKNRSRTRKKARE